MGSSTKDGQVLKGRTSLKKDKNGKISAKRGGENLNFSPTSFMNDLNKK